MPAVSVILPVYNGQEYLGSAIDSILAQEMSDFELLIIDDGSTDDSFHIASAYNDSRIVIIRNHRNLGLPSALNIGIEHASSDLIARQDQDDTSSTARLASQVEFLSAHPDVGVVGTWGRVVSTGSPESVINEHRHPTGDGELRWRLLWNSPFVHSSVMMRRSLVRQVGGYAPVAARSMPEDYDLWVRLSDVCSLANIPRFLQTYRETASGMSRQRRALITEGVRRISCDRLALVLPDVPQEEIEGLSDALNGQRGTTGSLSTAFQRLELLHRASSSVPGFRPARHAGAYWYTALRVMRNSLVNRAR